jgi:flavin reductase (DIM6/NTAB) family NADH-FMN oxidoreductase RutF
VDLRPFMAGFPTGVGIITTLADDGAPRGMTCTSICSVTLEPPTVLVCLRGDSATLHALIASSRFALHLLHAGARQVAEQFASSDRRRFETLSWHLPDGAGGPHLTGAAHAIADCRLVRVEPIGSHSVVFGCVFRISHHGEPRPLLYGLRRFAEWPDAPAAESGRTADSTPIVPGAPGQDHKGTHTR